MSHKRPVLLTLDDDSQIAEIMASIGDGAGFETTSTTTAEQFRHCLAAGPADVIILDLQMPGHDGVSMLRQLADDGVNAGIILVTGMDERTISSAEQYGVGRGLRMLGALQKPFDPDDLIGKLESAHAAIRPLNADDLADALRKDELILHYQPTLQRFADGSWDVAAVEALLRWDHPVRGLLTPDSFLRMGEDNGLMRDMTDFVIQRGMQQLKGWEASRLNIGLRINIAASLIADIDFPDRLEATLSEHALDANALTLEVTETGMLEEKPETFDILTRLRIKNINLAIDDFGIGYSSLTQLFRMPFNEMKIDKSLVMRVPESKEASIMVDALISLAHKLGLTVCAEGVEQAETLKFLDGIACDAAQGYYISAPAAAAEIPAIIARWDADATRRTRAAAG